MNGNPASKPALTTTRLEAFSDGVFAIAITLLIFGIKVPVIANHDASELKRQLFDLWPSYLSFVASFAIVSVFWIGHHQMFQLVSRSSRTLLWLNSALLMCVAFIPFPTAVLGIYEEQRVAIIFYCTTIIVAGLVFYLLWTYASARKRLLYPNTSSRVIQIVGWRILIGALFYGIALALAFVNLTLSRILLLLIPFFYLLPSSIDRVIET
jgi:uncharacterized membrane protein